MSNIINVGDCSMEEKKHAIVIIRNKDGKFLQYYDKRWDSYLFLNCKMDDNSGNDKIKSFLNEQFGISTHSIAVKFLDDIVHQKFSVSSNKEKKYHHYFYLVDVDMPEDMKMEEFEYQLISYQWFSMEELQNDKRIQEVNHDIVSYVKELLDID